MPTQVSDLPIEPPPPIVTRTGPGFWGEAIKVVISFIVAQVLIAIGLPMDDWARIALSAVGADISSGQAWWIAAFIIALAAYLASRALRPSVARASAL